MSLWEHRPNNPSNPKPIRTIDSARGDRSRERTVSYIGEEIGNLLDPGAGKDSVQWQFLEDLEAAGDAALGGR